MPLGFNDFAGGGFISGISDASIPDPYVVPDGDFNITGALSVSGNGSFGGTLGVTGVSTFAVGSAAAPGVTFTGATDTGVHCASGLLGLSQDGANALVFDASRNATFAAKTFVPDGTAAAPAYAFTDDTATGLYHDTTLGLMLSEAGAWRFCVGSTARLSVNLVPYGQDIYEVGIAGNEFTSQAATTHVAGTIAGNRQTAGTGGTVRAPDVTTGGAGNVVGADLTIAAGLGTGTGDVGQINLQTVQTLPAAGDNLQSRSTLMSLDGPTIKVTSSSNDASDIYAITVTSDNAGAGAPGGIDFSTMAVDEPNMKFVADAITTAGTVSQQIAIDIGGTTYYLVAYTHGS